MIYGQLTMVSLNQVISDLHLKDHMFYPTLAQISFFGYDWLIKAMKIGLKDPCAEAGNRKKSNHSYTVL